MFNIKSKLTPNLASYTHIEWSTRNSAPLVATKLQAAKDYRLTTPDTLPPRQNSTSKSEFSD